jgi:hypothetical protein
MPIEFLCGGCGTLLRVPDQSLGQFAACPTCEKHTLVRDSPEFRVVAAGGAASPPPLPTGPPLWTQAPPQTNPYAASEPSRPTADHPGDDFTGDHDLQYQSIAVGQLLADTWGLFRRNLGRSLLLGLGVTIASSIFNAANAFVGATDPASPTIVPVALMQFVATTLLMAIPTWFTLRWAREREMEGQIVPGPDTSPPPLDATSCGRILGGRFVVMLIVSAVAFLSILPLGLLLVGLFGASSSNGAVPAAASLVLAPVLLVGLAVFVRFYLRYLLVDHFILDRHSGIFPAIQESRNFTRGNVLAAFATLAILGLGAILFSLLTLGLGFVVVAPLLAFAQTAIYLRSTGQAIPRLDFQP